MIWVLSLVKKNIHKSAELEANVQSSSDVIPLSKYPHTENLQRKTIAQQWREKESTSSKSWKVKGDFYRTGQPKTESYEGQSWYLFQASEFYFLAPGIGWQHPLPLTVL